MKSKLMHLSSKIAHTYIICHSKSFVRLAEQIDLDNFPFQFSNENCPINVAEDSVYTLLGIITIWLVHERTLFITPLIMDFKIETLRLSKTEKHRLLLLRLLYSIYSGVWLKCYVST